MVQTNQSINRTRLLLVISNLTWGGAERQVIEIANQLDSARFDVHVCILSNHAPLAASLHNADERLHQISKKHKFDFGVVFRLAKLMNQLGTDVVHGFLFDAEISSRLAARLAGVRFVIGSERNSSHNYRTVNMLAYRLTAGLMTLCVANSEAGKRFNRETFKLPESRYRVVYNGVDTTRFRPRDHIEAKKHFDLPDDRFVIGMVGSFKRQKNHPYLLRVLQRLKEQRSDFCVAFVGTTIFEGDNESGAYFESVLAAIDEMNLGDCIKMLGPRDDVELFYNACDLTVLPSLYEGTPNVALESLSSGVPVIATDVADNRKVIPDAEVGYIVPLDDEALFAERVDTLLSDDDLRFSMQQYGRQWILQNFSVEKMIQNMAGVYDSIRSSGADDKR